MVCHYDHPNHRIFSAGACWRCSAALVCRSCQNPVRVAFCRFIVSCAASAPRTFRSESGAAFHFVVDQDGRLFGRLWLLSAIGLPRCRCGKPQDAGCRGSCACGECGPGGGRRRRGIGERDDGGEVGDVGLDGENGCVAARWCSCITACSTTTRPTSLRMECVDHG